MSKHGVGIIVDALPPPNRLGRQRPAKDDAEDAADGGADDATEDDAGKDYDPAEDSAAAFGAALGMPADKIDGGKILDAFRDLLKNARE